MIGLLLLYFIGKAFYELADKFNKNKWLFAILGIASYYAGTFLGGIILGAIGIFTGTNYIETTSDIAVSFLCLPIGLLFCWGFYKILKSQWSRNIILDNNDTLDSNLMEKA